MREIKFRAWHNGIMNYFKSHKSGILYYCEEMILSSGYDSYDRPTFNGDPEFELMQYTGLKDSKGVEIYEGDIVSISIYQPPAEYCGEETYEVCFSEAWASFGLTDGGAFWRMKEIGEPKVIGNIYENPELL